MPDNTHKYLRTLHLQDLSLEDTAGGRQILSLRFQDNYGSRFKWTPKWNEVEQTMFAALDVERKNEPGGQWSSELGRSAQGAMTIKSAEFVEGTIWNIEDGKFCFVDSPFGPEPVPSWLKLDIKWLETHLRRWHKLLLINGEVVKVYCDCDQKKGSAEDLPF